MWRRRWPMPSHTPAGGHWCARRPSSLSEWREPWSERHDSLEHHALELAAVLDVRDRVARVLLVHVFSLDHQTGQHEPAAGDLPSACADLIGDSHEGAFGAVVAHADKRFLLGQEAVDRIHRLLTPLALCGLGCRFTLGAFDDTEQLQAA